MLSEQVWCLNDGHMTIDKKTNTFTYPSELRNLYLQESEIGNNTLRIISNLACKGYFPHLECLDIGTNAVNKDGIDYLLEPLRCNPKQLINLKILNISLNKIFHDGILLMASNQNFGVFDSLIELDLSDIGCNTDSIALFCKAIVVRYEKGCLSKLLRLRVFGHHPFAGKNARVMFPEDFLTKVKVS